MGAWNAIDTPVRGTVGEQLDNILAAYRSPEKGSVVDTDHRRSFGRTRVVTVPISLEAWWWVPLLLDYGSLPGFVHTGIWILRRVA